jgi:hypothetical protein
MAAKLSENMSKLIHQMGQEREDRIISGKTNLTVAAIFLIDDNWKVFKEYRDIIGKPLRQEEIEEVEKMLRCKDPRYGFATYVCLGCGAQKIIGFSCNGRLCTYCGYRHARDYAERLADRLLDLPYRFFTFTIPAGLRSLVNQNAELLRIVQDSMFVALQETLEVAYNNELAEKASKKGLRREKDLKLKTGMLAGLQTFGGDMKTHIHEHCIIVDGGIDEYSQIVNVRDIPMPLLRRKIQYHVLTNLRKAIPGTWENRRLIHEMFQKYPNGFVVHDSGKAKNRKGIVRYIVRYIRHPAIANSRLIRYDGDEVTFWYEHKKERYTVVMKVFEFIESVIKHIPQKHQKMIRYYGLLSRKLRKWAEKVIDVWRRNEKRLLGQQLELFQNLLESKKEADEQRNRNRLQILCPRCFSEMELLFIAYPKDNELWVLGGWRWLEQRLIHREIMRREKQKCEEESAQLDFFSALRIAS